MRVQLTSERQVLSFVEEMKELPWMFQDKEMSELVQRLTL